MKKLMKYGMIGAMVLGAQSMVFASGISPEEGKMIKVTAAQKGAISATIKAETKDLINVDEMSAVKMEKAIVSKDGEENPLVESTEAAMVTMAKATELTKEEKAAEQVRVKEICEALQIEYTEGTTLGDLFEKLTEGQMDQLAQKGLIQVATPVAVTQSTAAVQK